jgi:hypothetical protein
MLDYKEDYNSIIIPSEIHASIKMGMDRGRKEVNARNKNVNAALKICASFIIALTLFTGGINISPSFAQALKDIPVLGKLVEVLQFTDGESGGGKRTDGSDISGIGLIEEDESENIVINFSQGNELQSDVGAFSVRYEENPYSMTFAIGGARRISAKKNFEKIMESKYVKDVYTIITLDDSLIRFVIEFEGPVKYELKEMKEPASIVIGLKEDTEFVEKSMYSLRTKSYPYGETLGRLEERLMRSGPTRVLKDSEGMYFVELQLFETEKDASDRLGELTELDDDTIFIEERFGTESPKSYLVQTDQPIINESLEKITGNTSGDGDTALNPSAYPVSINENGKYYYGNIEVLDTGLNIYSEDSEIETKYFIKYEESSFTKLIGEASYVLRIESGNKIIIASGVFSDFFDELAKYTEVGE